MFGAPFKATPIAKAIADTAIRVITVKVITLPIIPKSSVVALKFATNVFMIICFYDYWLDKFKVKHITVQVYFTLFY